MHVSTFPETMTDSTSSAMLQLPQELITSLLRTAGLKEVISSMPRNRKLHSAWQAAVDSVSVCTDDMTSRDVDTLSKMANMERLSLHGSCIGTVSLSRVIADASLYLRHLHTVIVDGIPGGFDVLIGLTGTESVADRINSLTVKDAQHVLCTKDLHALSKLRSLTCLQLHSQSMGTDDDHATLLAGISTCLRKLVNVSMHFEEYYLHSQHHFDALPGSITSLTSLDLISHWYVDEEQQQAHLIIAISALTNLRSLSTNFTLSDPQAQVQALQQLKQLTCLKLRAAAGQPDFCMLAALPALAQLSASRHSITDPFDHPALTKLSAGRLVASAHWRGKTAERCKLQELIITDWKDHCDLTEDSCLYSMPLLRHLGTIFFAAAPSNGRFLHLAALLRRQASSLRYINLFLAEPFQEALPRELPACTSLTFTCRMLTRAVLPVLCMCCMPRLRYVCLDLKPGSLVGLDVGADLGWLRGLPELEEVEISGMGAGEEAEGVRAGVAALLQGTGVSLKLQ